jgi:hypothetical protein
VTSAPSSELSGYTCLPEPELMFGGARKHRHPLLGLVGHGPYGLKFGMPSRLRLALLAPRRDMGRLEGLVRELDTPVKPREAVNYYPEYPGFSQLFRIPIAEQDDRLSLHFPDQLESYAERRAKRDLARELFQCIAQLKPLRSSFDVTLIYLPESWAECFEGERFDLHDYLKAYCAPSGIPI